MAEVLQSQKVSLIEETIRNGLGSLSCDGSLMVETGKYTGRAVKDRFIANRPEISQSIAWNSANMPIDPELSKTFFERLEKRVQSKKNYSIDAFVGPFPIEVLSTSPWHIAFCDNMFRNNRSPLPGFRGGDIRIKIYHDPFGKVSDLGLNHPSETLLILDPVEMKAGIIGTAYAGEIKKSAFTLCNYKLPSFGIFPMHASANCLEDGSESSVLFGLSGTGKTTLSASHDRFLIGDDEIVWSETGLTNLEGGCYAKLIDLTLEREPEIFRAVNQFGSIMENIVFNEQSRVANFADRSKTENTRGSYPLSALQKVFDQSKEAAPPKTIVFLMADAFGAMPSVARLNPWQAQYYFVSGYTAKVAGTELGIKEPQAAFSTCFGAPFMPLPSATYARLLADHVQKSGATVWLLNTGWTEGGYAKGSRFPLAVSRQILNSIQSGELAKQKVIRHPVFGFEVPMNCPGLDAKYLGSPSGEPVAALSAKFKANIEQFREKVDARVFDLGGPLSV